MREAQDELHIVGIADEQLAQELAGLGVEAGFFITQDHIADDAHPVAIGDDALESRVRFGVKPLAQQQVAHLQALARRQVFGGVEQ